MPAGFHLLIAAQFASALADNALLIITIALLMEIGTVTGLIAWRVLRTVQDGQI